MNAKNKRLRNRLKLPAYLKLSDEIFQEKIQFADSILEKCSLCPRKCSASRIDGEKGFCMQSNNASIAYYGLHLGEEPCLIGMKGAGTVFFAGCTLSCVFCQNYQISQAYDYSSYEVPPEVLAGFFLDLQSRGASVLDLVTPTPHISAILKALYIAKNKGFTLPVVYNTNSYISVEALDIITGIVDIYLADFKYFSSSVALKYSKAGDYPKHALYALKRMYLDRSVFFLDDNGQAYKGVLARILLLPNRIEEAEKILQLLASCGLFPAISIMSQFSPFYNAGKYPELCVELERDRVLKLVGYAGNLGFQDIFYQSCEAKNVFKPDFNKPNPFE